MRVDTRAAVPAELIRGTVPASQSADAVRVVRIVEALQGTPSTFATFTLESAARALVRAGILAESRPGHFVLASGSFVGGAL